jgi:hypothetical protein
MPPSKCKRQWWVPHRLTNLDRWITKSKWSSVQCLSSRHIVRLISQSDSVSTLITSCLHKTELSQWLALFFSEIWQERSKVDSEFSLCAPLLINYLSKSGVSARSESVSRSPMFISRRYILSYTQYWERKGHENGLISSVNKYMWYQTLICY